MIKAPQPAPSSRQHRLAAGAAQLVGLALLAGGLGMVRVWAAFVTLGVGALLIGVAWERS